MTAIAPTTSSHRKYRLPCLVMRPSLSLPPVLCCFGTNPIQAARPRPDEKVLQSPISATNAVALSGPMPGISANRRLASQNHDVLVDGCDLSADRAILPCQHLENAAHGRRHPAIRDNPEQFCRSIPALGRHDAQFG